MVSNFKEPQRFYMRTLRMGLGSATTERIFVD